MCFHLVVWGSVAEQQVLVDLLTATAAAQEGHFDVTIDEPVGLSLFSATLDPCEPFDPEDPTPVWCTATLLLDEGGNYWEVAAMNDTSLNVTIRRPLGGIAEPVLDSGSQARIFQYTNDPDFVSERYGSQHVDVLNFPQNYVESGDVVSDGAAVLNDLSHITVTVDQVIP